MRRWPIRFLTLLYAALSFLGHGGLHAIEGTGGHHHVHAQGTNHRVSGHIFTQHAHRHAHDGCNGQHTDSRSEATGPAGESPQPPAPHDHAPAHDHDSCLICQWHAQGKTTVDAPAATSLEAPCLGSLGVEDLLKPATNALSVRSRGPPTC